MRGRGGRWNLAFEHIAWMGRGALGEFIGVCIITGVILAPDLQYLVFTYIDLDGYGL